ncbi:MAG: CBS domain-containing protein, partial [Caldilineae bacterium]
MHLILTHERADFDAIASLLGAARLYPDGIPLVPRDVNQNVRDFLTLYWDELPFTEFHNRPKGKISRITMVDSQYIPTIRGRTPQTQLRVIDHHAPGEHLPPEAEATLIETGATATYLVEEIARANLKITPIQATLLLLGIYEDCGSLTYQNTTPRDIRAAAWLLEQGASLDILRDFLHHPLSPPQQRLYHAIVNHLQTLTIKGHPVLLSAVQTGEHVTEISTLAHQLRDLYNPECLFLLIGYEDGQNKYVQLIARSTTDAVHVGRVAERFGGGGHPRAAAAHIAGGELEAVRQKLLAVLEEVIQPAPTVRQIMSFRVRTVSPEQTIQQAADMMTRYGHEGYPVVEKGKIVGILTRRQIDKALHHRLGNAPIRQYMHAGEIYVTPDDTVEHLQSVMLRERVGQVPVVEKGKIIGVVTRTDLINLWSRGVESAPTTLNLADRLQEALPAPLLDLLREAGAEGARIGSSLYIVGGFVRDLLLRRPVLDIDLVVEGDAIALARAMQRKYGGRIRSHKRFGTANWIIEGAIEGIDRLDFVTARTEFYQHPTALPEVEQSSIKQDLHRRDFTINTLAIRLDPDGFGDLLDFYGGYRDLQNRLIRVLHSLSFVEDPTRILRAIRLEQRLGFHLGRRTLEHLQNALDLLPRVSADRIFAELAYTLQEEEPEKALLRLDALGVLRTIHPDLHAGDWFAGRCRLLREGRDGTPWANIRPDVPHYLG